MAGTRTIAKDVKLNIGLAGTTVNFESRRSSEKADSFKSICPVCATDGIASPVQQGYTCKTDPGHGTFGIKDCAKGKEISKTEIVPVTAAEIESIRTAANATGKVMDLNFHPAEQVAHLVPTGISYAAVAPGKPDPFYGVLASQLGNPTLVCMGKIVLAGKEKVFQVTLGPTGLIVSELCREADLHVVATTAYTVDEKHLPVAKMLVEAVTCDYDPAAYTDHTAERLADLLAAKAADPTATVTPIRPITPEPEVDMMAMLKASLDAIQAKRSVA